MIELATVLTWSSVATGLLAAVLWWLASAVSIPPFPDVGLDSHGGVFEPIRTALAKAAILNKWAAAATGFAVALLTAVAYLPR